MNKLNSLIEYLLYILVFLLPWQTRYILRPGLLNDGYLEYLSISVYLTDFILVFLLTLFVWQLVKSLKNRNFSISPFLYILGALELVVIASIFFAPDPVLALYKYLLFIVLGGSLFFLVLRGSYNKIKLIYSLVIGLALQALLGIYQFISQSSFASKYLGLAKHDPAVLGDSVLVAGGERILRAYGSLDHPNIFGAVAVIGFILSIYLIRYYKKEKTYLNYYLVTLFVVAVILSFSRTAYLALGVSAVIILVSYFRDIKKNILQNNLPMVILGVIIIIFTLVQSAPLMISRFQTGARLETKSIEERVNYIEDARNISADNYLMGVGMGNYSLAVAELKPDHEAWYYQPVHNVFLLISSELGLLALIIFVVFLYYILKQTTNIFGLSIIVSLLIFLSLDHWLWTLHFGILFLWLLLAGIARKDFFK